MNKTLKNALLFSCVTIAALVLMSRWPEILPRLAGANWLLLSAATIGLLIYQFLNAGVWSLVLGALGHRAPFAKAAKIWIQSEALRWLPGGIWGYGSRVFNASELGVSKAKASSSLVLELALTNLAWATTAALLLFTPLAGLVRESARQFLEELTPSILLSLTVTTALALMTVILVFRTKKHHLLRHLTTRLSWQELHGGRVACTLIAYSALCIFNGLLLWLVIVAVPNLSMSPLVAIGIGGGAWLAGFWAIGIPGGIGVREAALAAMFAFFGDLDSGLAVAVLWRALQMTVELASLLLVSLPDRLKSKKPKVIEEDLAKSEKESEFNRIRVCKLP